MDSNANQFQSACGAVAPIDLRIEIPGTSATFSRKWNAAFILIGSDPHCDLCLEHKDISKFHAYLQIIGGRIFCIDLCSNSGTHWENGSEGSGWLDAQKSVGIGPFRIRPAANEKARSGDSILTDILNPLQALPKRNNLLPRLMFDIKKGHHEPVRWRMRPIVVLLGSSPRCNICIGGPDIEPFHASLVGTPRDTWLVNFAGTTLLNGACVRCAPLHNDDLLQIGRFHFRALYEQARTNSPIPGSALLTTDSPAYDLEKQAENWTADRDIQRPFSPQTKPMALTGPLAQMENGSGLQPAQRSLIPQANSSEWQPGAVNEPDPPVPALMNAVGALQLTRRSEDANWAGLPQALLLQVLTQHQLLQQQMAQNQESMTLLCSLLGTLLKDQRGGIREDIEKLQKTTNDLKFIQLQLAKQTAAEPDPIVNTSPLPSETPPPPKPSSDRNRKGSASPAPKQVISNNTAVENPELSHGILVERMAALQGEQQSTLQKLLKYLHV